MSSFFELEETRLKGFTGLKVDMRKDYDRVERSDLCIIMLAPGFHPEWVNLIMDCVSTPSFAVLINGRR